MIANVTTWAILGTLIVAAFGYIAVMLFRDIREPRDLLVDHTPHHAAARMYQHGPVIYTHSAPARPFTPEQAHEAMQQHRECDHCPRRHAARDALIEAGHITPDSHRS